MVHTYTSATGRRDSFFPLSCSSSLFLPLPSTSSFFLLFFFIPFSHLFLSFFFILFQMFIFFLKNWESGEPLSLFFPDLFHPPCPSLLFTSLLSFFALFPFLYPFEPFFTDPPFSSLFSPFSQLFLPSLTFSPLFTSVLSCSPPVLFFLEKGRQKHGGMERPVEEIASLAANARVQGAMGLDKKAETRCTRWVSRATLRSATF